VESRLARSVTSDQAGRAARSRMAPRAPGATLRTNRIFIPSVVVPTIRRAGSPAIRFQDATACRSARRFWAPTVRCGRRRPA